MMPFPVVEEAALPDSPAPTGLADAEPKSALSSHVRLQLERVDGLTVIGWAVSTGGQAAQIQLLVNGEVAEAAVSAVPRQDVADALGLTESKDVGFRLSLPPGIWGADSGERRSVELRAGGVQVEVPLPQTFNELVRQLRDSEDSGLVAEQLIALQLHARALPRRVLAPDAAAWLQQQELERAAADARREMALEEGPRPRGQVERVEAAVVQGWCWLSDSSEEAVTLHTSEGLLDCSVIRVERNDVQAALQSERRRLGFEIEIPATVWQSAADEQSVCLMVRVDGRLLQAEPVVLSRVQIPSWLEQVRQAELQADTLVATAARQEWQYRCLLLIEHVVAAGMLHSLDLPLQAFVRANAERFGLSTLLQGEASASFASDRVLAEPKGPDFGTLTNWRLMRAFNQALVATGDQPMTALDQVLAAHQPGAQVTERFLWAVLPFFCSRGLYAALRLRLEGAHLRALASSSSAFDLSLLLPEAACSGDLHLAQMAMKKLSQATEGWLNTECIHEAVRIVMQTSDPRRLQQGDAVDFLNAFFAFVEHLGDQGYWSRLHDSHVVGALVSVLKLQSALSVGAAKWAVDILWRRFGLVPDFWRRLDTVEPPLGGWGARTEDARQDFRAVESMLSNRSDEGGRRAGLEALERFRVAGNPDAQIIARELAMSSRETSRSALFSLLTQSPADLIRLAAHPLANRLVPVHRAGLAEAIRALSGIPQVPRRAAVAAFVDACLATGGAAAPRTGPVRSEALLPVSLRENHYLGVRLLCAAWLREHGESPASGKSDSWLVDLREQWFGAFDDCADLPHPPATLSATVSLLGAAPVAAGGSAQQVVAEMRRAMKARYGPVAALAEAGACEQPRLAAGIGGHSTLVAIYSCVRNLPTRVQAIRDTWARDLTARGIPWVVVVGDGDGQLRGDVLHLDAPDDYESLPAKTLALVDWVYRHTRFEHLVKIDDDCHLAVDAYFDEAPFLAHHYHGRLLHRAIGATDRIWHQAKSRGARAAAAADKTPEPSTYADGSSAYVLSRYAMAQVALALDSTVGARLTRSAFLEDKLLGDLLATRGLAVSNEGHYTLIRRRFGPAALPVNAWDNLFYPSQASPTLVTHLDDHLPMASVQAGMGDAALRPPRLWPTDRPVQISGHQTNQLELLSDPARLALLDDARFLVVAVARNEKVLLPHFLAHYRRLGATAFVLVDNLSDDGTREYLHAQPDVILYSADTEYKESHYGVSWQQAVLAAHAVGRWVVLADIDEFLVYPGCEQRPLADWLTTLEAEGHDAARVLMVDMYPACPLHEADFEQHDPFALATCYDREPLLPWRLGSGSFSNSPTWLSALRHRLIPDSAPNIYTSQKLAVVKYQPWIRFAEGLHYASNLIVAPDPVWFAHFKYHAGFQRKVQTEVARKQHFNGAEEYRKYAGMLAEARDSLAEPGVTATYAGSRSWAR